MRVDDWLKKATITLEAAGIATARLDAEVLLADVFNLDRSWQLTHPEHMLGKEDLLQLETLVARRVEHEPLAYIRGKQEFFGREFSVSPDTLTPRPETETMLELLFKLVKAQKSPVKSVVDVGTGSGCIAVSAKLELPNIDVYAVEINETALKIARQNAKELGAVVNFYRGNLLEPLLTFTLQPTTIILANLPYVPENFQINLAASHEPRVAIFGGDDGLDLYRELFLQLSALKTQPSTVMTESLPPQHADMRLIAEQAGYQEFTSVDFIQAFKLA